MSKSKYTFSNEIKAELAKLESHLKEKKYNVHTIRQYKNCTGIYIEWLNKNNYTADEMTYKIVIEFIQESQQTHSMNHVKRIIISIKHYHDCIKNAINPVTGIFIKGQQKSILNDIIDYKQLGECYDNFAALDDRSKRNKMMLSLIINQAVTTAELHLLEPGHIRLKEGKIYIPGHEDVNSRILDLEAAQMIELQEYLLVVRPSMINNIFTAKSGKKPDVIKSEIYDKLFIGENGGHALKTTLQYMFKKIKKVYPRIASGSIIRATVLAEWLKTIDIRKVQYMAGHRYVSTTERYNVMNLQELKDSLNKYHPMK